VRIVIILDFISIIFIFTVCLISLRVSVFSNSYIISEKYFRRFIILVLLFIISIFLLILRPNLISILLGWDGLGVTSYLLVIFYQSHKSYNAGIITAMTNRLGDVGILLAIGLLLFKGS
jgi:NADH-ubiquinone oxidoreductase chain 5